MSKCCVVRDNGNEEGTIAVNQARYTLDKQVNAVGETPFSYSTIVRADYDGSRRIGGRVERKP